SSDPFHNPQTAPAANVRMKAGAIVTAATMYSPTNSTAPHTPNVERYVTAEAIQSITIQKVLNRLDVALLTSGDRVVAASRTRARGARALLPPVVTRR